MSDHHIPYGRQALDDDDIAAVTDVLRGDWLTGGPAVPEFEEALREHTGASHVVACSSGTAALHMAAIALGIGAGDKVIVPAVTFLASASAFRFQGADIVFADVDPRTGLLTPETLQRCIDDRTDGDIAAVVPVYLGGRCDSPAAIAEIASAHGAAVIEDACHALGSYYDSGNERHRVGSGAHADISVFSFHPVKTITSGEGGAATTADAEIAAALRLARNHGMTRDPAAFVNDRRAFDDNGKPNPWYYEAQGIAPNYRASDIHCALGTSQLRKFPGFAKRRQELAARYDSLLASLSPVISAIGAVPGCDPVLHLYAVHIDFAALGIDRAKAMRLLSENGIGTQVHYIPLHLQPYFAALNPGLSLPGAESYYTSTLSLPLFPAMTEDDQDRVIAALGALVGDHKKVSKKT